MSTNTCPCGSGKEYEACCRPVIMGDIPAPTAESLMRARYTAYCEGELGYLYTSVCEKKKPMHDADAVRDWAESSKWVGLTVHSVKDGGEDDMTGEVEFTATFEQGGERHDHTELSFFERENGEWVYVDGRVRGNPTVRREIPKVGRNEPCPCGSGKKFKKCCGK